jgi:platelet-activating factor acetylhydrolase
LQHIIIIIIIMAWLKVVYGGLHPIIWLMDLDIVIFLALCYATFSSASGPNNLNVLLVSSVCALSSLALTKQWMLLFPGLPFLALQLLRRVVEAKPWAGIVIVILSSILLAVGGALVVVFPTVQLPHVKGPYTVGMADFYLPIDMGGDQACKSGDKDKDACDDPWSGDLITHVPVRLLYPTLDKPGSVRHLKSRVALEFCKQTMKFGAPPSIQEFSWIMHTWTVAGLRAKQNASLLPSDKAEKLPIVIYSHGLGGTSDTYSYQTMALASQGYVVLAINHQDGSAPVVERVDGSLLTFDFEIPGVKEADDEMKTEYYRARRSRTNLRVRELVASTEKLLEMNEKDLPELKELNLSLKGRLQTDHTLFMGHSFGGATVLTAAKRRPDLIKAVIAHDPATQWMPDDARKSLFPEDRLEGLSHVFTGGQGGYEDPKMKDDSGTFLHDVTMLLLFSNEWRKTGFCFCDILEDMYKAGRIGPKGGSSSLSVISEAHHQEFRYVRNPSCSLAVVYLFTCVSRLSYCTTS